MDFVDEHYRTPHAAPLLLLRLGNELAQLGYATGYSVDGDELLACHVGNDLRQRCLTRARRPVEEHRLQHITLNHPPQGTPLAHGLFLPHKVAQFFRPHAVRQRLRLPLFLFK